MIVCARRPYFVEAVERPDLRFPASCDSYGCEVCGLRKVHSTAAVITWSMRQSDRCRLVTLTGVPPDWQPRRKKVRSLVADVRALGYRWEWSWTTEANPAGTGYHVHGVQHGDYVPQALLQHLWGRIVHLEGVGKNELDLAAGRYTIKEALRVAGYTLKNAESGGLPAHLVLNGGRAAHWSRGFLHGNTKREALTEVRKDLADGEALTWRLVPAWRIEAGADSTARSAGTPAAVTVVQSASVPVSRA